MSIYLLWTSWELIFFKFNTVVFLKDSERFNLFKIWSI
jgi:hypothetical protein